MFTTPKPVWCSYPAYGRAESPRSHPWAQPPGSSSPRVMAHQAQRTVSASEANRSAASDRPARARGSATRSMISWA